MRRIILLIVFSLAMCGFSFAQSPLADFEKAREIKLLDATRDNVRRILVDYEPYNYDEEADEIGFSSETTEIQVKFSSGDCSDNYEYWNVAKGVATQIEITFLNDVKVEDFRFDFSNFTKEVMSENYAENPIYQKVKLGENPDYYIYQNENLGIVFKISDDEIEKIFLVLSKTRASSLCKNENTEKILSKKHRLIDSILRDDVCIFVSPPANVEDLILSADEIIIGCKDAKNKACPNGSRKISVKTIARDPDNDVLTYVYTVSGGSIVGQGANVVWDLTGVGAGTYTITTGVDDGMGVVGTTKTQTIVVKECTDCSQKQSSGAQKQSTDTEKQPSGKEKQLTEAKKQVSDTKKQ